MHLLNARTRKLETFVGRSTPPYAILSHTWADDEVTFEDLTDVRVNVESKKGYLKIRYTCDQALEDHLEYAWVDACCIDKSSSAELSEAINAMYRWYEKAQKCYAYLSDVSASSDAPRDGLPGEWQHITNGFLDSTRKQEILSQYRGLGGSRWFSRGWTLQELIAPLVTRMVFFDEHWQRIGNRDGPLTEIISGITGVDASVFGSTGNLPRFSIAQRMSWAAQRRTTREEDEAYSLLGIFGVNLPLIYGEGKKAFIRLQKAIVSESADQTIFAWDVYLTPERIAINNLGLPKLFLDCFLETNYSAILAPGAYAFAAFPHISRGQERQSVTGPYAFTNNGLEITLPVISYPAGDRVLAILNCRIRRGWLGLWLSRKHRKSEKFYVLETRCGERIEYVDATTARSAKDTPLKLVEAPPLPGEAGSVEFDDPLLLLLNITPSRRMLPGQELFIESFWPKDLWQSYRWGGSTPGKSLRTAQFVPKRETVKVGAFVLRDLELASASILISFCYDSSVKLSLRVSYLRDDVAKECRKHYDDVHTAWYEESKQYPFGKSERQPRKERILQLHDSAWDLVAILQTEIIVGVVHVVLDVKFLDREEGQEMAASDFALSLLPTGGSPLQ